MIKAIPHLFFTWLALASLEGRAAAENPLATAATALEWSTLNLRSGTVGDEFQAYGDVFAPLYWDEQTVFFLQPYSHHTTSKDTDTGLGIGFRTTIVDDWSIGANLFYDHDRLHGGGSFDVDQLGVGLEIEGPVLSLHANGYFPDSHEHLASSQRVGERTVALNAPYGTQHSIAQDIQVRGVNSEHWVAASQGCDAEVGGRVPWISRWMEVQAWAGGYWYENRSGADVKGFKARAEARLTEWLHLEAGWVDDKAVVGGNWFAGVHVSLPLGRKQTPKPSLDSPQMSDLKRRAREHLLQSVERNGRAVVATQFARTTEQVLVERRAVTLRNRIVFVDNQLGRPDGAGTFEQPVSSIQAGVNRSALSFGGAGTVFVQGRPVPYRESVLIRDGVQLFGSGEGLPVVSPVTGLTSFHGRTSTTPAVAGGFLARDVMAPIGFTGFEFTDSITSGLVSATGRPAAGTNIYLENVTSATLYHNEFHNSATATAGIYVETNGDRRAAVLISSNNLHDNPGQPTQGYQGIVLSSAGTSRLDALVTGNTILRNGGDGLAAATFDSSTINATLDANRIGFNAADQIIGFNQGGVLRFISQGTRSNSLFETLGATHLYEFFSGSPQGSIWINGLLQPADTNLP